MWCVIPAAGRATRLGPAVGAPKLLLEVAGRPLIDHLLERLAPAVTQACVVLGPDAAGVPEALGGRWGGVGLHYAVQPRPLGVADAVARAEELVEGPFAVAMGDVFWEEPLAPALARWRGSGVPGAVLVEPPGGRPAGPTGVVRLQADRVTEIRKAPPGAAGRFQARVCGLAVFPATGFRWLRDVRAGDTGETEMEDAVAAMIAAGVEFLAVPYRGWRRNINLAEDLEAVRRRVGR